MDSGSFKLETNDWRLLKVLENEVRVEIVRMLIAFEFRSLSEISGILEKRGWKMTLSGVLKHMKELEKIGVVRCEAGIFAETPDARKTIYFLEGRERVEGILQHLQGDIVDPLRAGLIFSEASKLARQLQGARYGLTGEQRSQLESLLARCESEKVSKHLTEDEKKKLKLWRMIIAII
jgi:DNA-binding transcriptional ArsR family regulator